MELQRINKMIKPNEHRHNIDEIEGLAEFIASNSSSGGGIATARKRDVFTSTEGQRLFTLSGSYLVGHNLLNVVVGGVPQYPAENYAETSETSFTLAAGVPAGVTVVAEYFTDVKMAADYVAATANTDGLLTAADKQKLDTIGENVVSTTITNSLTSDATDEALAAAQGKLLNESKADKADLTILGETVTNHIAQKGQPNGFAALTNWGTVETAFNIVGPKTPLTIVTRERTDHGIGLSMTISELANSSTGDYILFVCSAANIAISKSGLYLVNGGTSVITPVIPLSDVSVELAAQVITITNTTGQNRSLAASLVRCL